MSREINTAFIGIGSLNSKQHLPNAFHNALFHISAICDVNRDALDKYAGLYSPDMVTTDYKELLKKPEIELVVMALPPRFHAPMSIEFLEAGKHVYVEKPLSEDIESSIKVAKTVKATRKKLAVGFNRRFAPSYLDAFEIIKNDKGPIMINYRMVDDERDRPPLHNGRPRLLDEACHVFDVFNWFARSEPVNIYATEFGRIGDNQVIVEYENGVSAALVISSHGAFHWPKERMEIVGDNKVVAVEDFVELQTGGVPGWTQKNYPGREFDGFSKGYAKAYEELGLPFYRYMRRMMGDLLLDNKLIEKNPEKEKWGVVGEMFPDNIRIPVNYSCDKGWYNALDHFGRCILEDRGPCNSDAIDGVKATVMSIKAMESVKSRTVQSIDKDIWKI
ncbi:MAG: hypothetical protein A2017_14180 [Lentisphaerae bacterium GWF2_44_16]|nr:MAG: hypothetical protein A2017_14180 [Lentisphaerae bacterium GWF2_44_16]